MTNDGRKSASTLTSGVPLRPTANRPATMMTAGTVIARARYPATATS